MRGWGVGGAGAGVGDEGAHSLVRALVAAGFDAGDGAGGDPLQVDGRGSERIEILGDSGRKKKKTGEQTERQKRDGRAVCFESSEAVGALQRAKHAVRRGFDDESGGREPARTD